MKRTQQDVGTIIRKKKARGPDIWVWRFYEVDEMGITRKRSVMLAGDAEEWPTEAHAWQGSREFRYQRMEQSCGQSFGALVKRYMHEAMPERYSTKKSYASILKRHILPQWGNAVGRGEKALEGGTVAERVEAFSQNEVQYKGSPASHF